MPEYKVFMTDIYIMEGKSLQDVEKRIKDKKIKRSDYIKSNLVIKRYRGGENNEN